MPKQHVKFSKSLDEILLRFSFLQLDYCSIIESIEKLGNSTELKKLNDLLKREACDLNKIQLGLVLVLLKENSTLLPQKKVKEAVE